jgi:flagellar basal-body rod protein FlgB
MSNSPDLMQMLTGQMRYSAERQKVLAQNISNIDTPGYKAKDVKQPDFAKLVEGESTGGGLAMRTTSPKHFGGNLGGSGVFRIEEAHSGSETSPNGNSVSLEDQMAKVSDTGAQYEISSSLYKKFTQLYRTALGSK